MISIMQTDAIILHIQSDPFNVVIRSHYEITLLISIILFSIFCPNYFLNCLLF